MDTLSIARLCQHLAASPAVWTAVLLATAVHLARLLQAAFFSPLAHIPGPLLNRFTNLPLMYHALRGQYPIYMRQLHAKYGEIVRTGHDHISLANTADTRYILSSHAFRKGPLYEKSTVLAANSFLTTDPQLNKMRRRQIGDAFSAHTVGALEELIFESGTSSLMSAWDRAIANQGGSGALVNYYDSFYRMSYDVIGELGFGQSFGILATGDTRIIDMFQELIRLKNVRSLTPFASHMRWMFVRLNRAINALYGLAHDTVTRRKQYIDEFGSPPRTDVLQKLIDARDPTTGEKLDIHSLCSEILLLLVAGTDTTSNTLTWTLMNLLHHPRVYERVTSEIRAAFPATSRPITYAEAKQRLPYLTAVVYESMRLNPAVSGMLPRSAPWDGATIQGKFIPSRTQICVSIDACHRNPRTWPNPDVFDPERFLGENAEVRMKDNIAFSSGVRVCIGRNLAWMQIYSVLANILRKYDFALPAGAAYGPHRTNSEGVPVAIPAVSFIVTGPANPKRDCLVNISVY